MLATRVRTKPCIDLQCLVSLDRSTITCSFSCRTFVSTGISWLSSPFGPFTFTKVPSIFKFTPAGSGIGFLPILDKINTPFSDLTLAQDIVILRALPDITEDFSAKTFFARGFVRHYPLGCREHRHTQPPKYLGDLVFANINPEPG